MRRRRTGGTSAAVTALLFAAWLGGWELLSRGGLLPQLFFPPPSAVAATVAEQLAHGDLARHLGATSLRVLLGIVFGGIPGYLLGMWMGWSPGIRRVLDPFVAAVHATPKITLLPIVMIFLGIGTASRTFVVALSVFFPVLINTMAGVRQIHPLYFEVARNYGASPTQVFRKVVVPGSLPFVLAGIRLGLNVALSLTMAVELVAAEVGIGTMIWLAWQTLRVEDLYAGVAMAALMGIAIRWVVQSLTVHLVPWQAEDGR